jgi:signal transduction histidine kinase/CheY-like chemotaxis protein
MSSHTPSRDESARLRHVRSLDLVGAPADAGLDALASAAAHVLECPVAFVGLMEAEHQTFIGRHGMLLDARPRAESLCHTVVSARDALIVEDAAADPRFAAHPAVVGVEALRFYAGTPLSIAGEVVGTLCAFDSQPHGPTPAQLFAFGALARAAEEALVRAAQVRALQARIDRLLAPNAGALFELEQLPQGRLRLEHVNEPLARLFALEPRTPQENAEALLARVHRDDIGAFVVSMHEAARHERPWSFEVRLQILQDAQSGPRWVAGSALAVTLGPGHVLWRGHVCDVSQRRGSAEAMVQTQRRLHHAMRIGGLGVLEIDLEAGSVERDHQAVKLHGRSGPSGRQPLDEWLQSVAADDRVRVQQALDVAGSGAGGTRVRYHTGAGASLNLIELLLERGDSIRRLVGLCRDVTEQERLALAQREQVAAELSSKRQSEFLSRVSHELRTPMHAILGFVELMRNDSGSPLADRHGQWAQQVHKAGHHLLALINDLLDLTRIDADPKALELVSLSAVEAFDAVRDMLVPLAEPQRVVVERVQGALHLRVRGNARALEQALLNVVANAIKFNRDGGHVCCRIEVRDRSHAAFVVCDEGPGVPASQRARLFQPFERLGHEARTDEGSGLGLAITQRLVEAMGGRVEATFPPHGGTCIALCLPLADARDTVSGFDEPTVPAPLVTPPPRVDSTPRRRAIYAEDNPVNAMLLRAMFELRDDWTLVTVTNGAQLLADVSSTPPDLVLLDMHLGGESGGDVLRALRARPDGAALACVALSADAQPDQIAKALAAGFDDYWTKPIDLGTLYQRLDALTPPRE